MSSATVGVRDAAVLDSETAAFVRSPFYPAWRAKVEASGGCAHPVHLTGSQTVVDTRTDTVLATRAGQVYVGCGTRRANVCPSCAAVYAADAFHLVRAGLAGGSKGVPVAVQSRPRLFATLTAPSFGRVHNRPISKAGRVKRCACGKWHQREDDPRLGTAIDPDGYDYVGAVLWNAHASALWHRFRITLRRHLAHAAGIPVRAIADHLRVSYGRVAEYQRRGLVHFHAAIRLDGPAGPTEAPPAWATVELLEACIRTAAAAVSLSIGRPGTGELLELSWGGQVDTSAITAKTAEQIEDAGQISEERLAAYVAKYATKSTGASAGDAADRRIRSRQHIDALAVPEHHRAMIATAWDLGGMLQYDGLHLRRWAHMLGFGGHFLTKSARYSTTFGQLRAARTQHRTGQTVAALELDGGQAEYIQVVNDWEYTGIGHRDTVEAELAEAIATRIIQNRQSKGESTRESTGGGDRAHG